MAIIALHSKIGGGKDTTATIIQALDYYHNKSETNTKTKFTDVQFCLGVINNDYSYYSDWQVKKFADKLKDIVCILLGCTREQLENREFKEKELREEWWYYKHESGLYSYLQEKDFFIKVLRSEAESEELVTEKEIESYLVKTTSRLLLQLIGTQCGRQIIHPDIWCNSLMNKYILSNETIYVYITGRWDCDGTFIRVILDREVEIGTKSLDENWIVDSGNLKDGYFLKPLKGQFQNEHRILRPGYRFSIYHKKEVYPSWCISDLRFSNEFKAVKDKGGICIKIVRNLRTSEEWQKQYHLIQVLDPDGWNRDERFQHEWYEELITLQEYQRRMMYSTCMNHGADLKTYFIKEHESETALDHITDWDYVVDNNGTLEELIEKVKIILIKENIIQ